MNFVLCSNFDNADEILQYATEYFEKCHYYPKIKTFWDKQEFLMEMDKRGNDILLIAWAKAKGMEIVRQTADKNKEAKIIWVSDDEDFVRFARDHNISYFTLKYDRKTIENALEACGVTPSENYYCGNI
ncbi:hypothetical protein [Aminipila sp.]|uniref:hypothetical protein n=1 Tax=Aminipila sp. TaxID=2060095 RepID=UPI00289FA0F1|nr:hypothetical protein [Aminipila sp.]